MGYNERNPIFSLRLGEYRHGKINKLAKLEKMPAVDLVRKIIDQLISDPQNNEIFLWRLYILTKMLRNY